MNSFWFPWYPQLYRNDTLHLTPEQDGIYRRLIDHYMESASPLPDNVVALCRIAGCDSHAISIPLAFFAHEEGIGYRHKKCDSLLADMYERHQKRHGAAKAGANARWKKIHKLQSEKCYSHANSNAVAMRFDATLTPTLKKEPPIVPQGTVMPFSEIPPEWKTWAQKERGWDEGTIADTWQEFHSYWTEGKGKKTKRSEWGATWRNWCRKQNISSKTKPPIALARANVRTLGGKDA